MYRNTKLPLVNIIHLFNYLIESPLILFLRFSYSCRRCFATIYLICCALPLSIPPLANSQARWTEAVITATNPSSPSPSSHASTNPSNSDDENRDAAATASPVIGSHSLISEVDEFLPEVNESAMQVLNLAGDEAILFSAKNKGTGCETDDEDDDDDTVPMEMLMPDESLLPDMDQDRITDDNLSEDEFRLQPRVAVKKGAPKPSSNVIITTSDEEDEDEESLAKGLNFDDFSDVDASQQPLVASYHSHKGGSSSRGGAVPKELTGLVTDFVSNMIPWNKVGNLIVGGGGDNNLMSRSESAVGQTKKKRAVETKQQPSFESSSDDSEFELLNTDELRSYET